MCYNCAFVPSTGKYSDQIKKSWPKETQLSVLPMKEVLSLSKVYLHKVLNGLSEEDSQQSDADIDLRQYTIDTTEICRIESPLGSSIETINS